MLDTVFSLLGLVREHPANVYERRAKSNAEHESYVDNLALADNSLAQLMEVLNATPAAAKTTIIVCSDHSWRVPI